jgi:hypothetical protein
VIEYKKCEWRVGPFYISSFASLAASFASYATLASAFFAAQRPWLQLFSLPQQLSWLLPLLSFWLYLRTTYCERKKRIVAGDEQTVTIAL